MGTTGGMGILMTFAEGDSRLLPLEFSYIDGAWWAAAPLALYDHLRACEGRETDVILLEGETAHVRGVLRCDFAPEDRVRLVRAQSRPALDGIIVKILPDHSAEAGQDMREAA